MRTDTQYLEDIRDAADAIGRFVAGRDENAFLADELRQAAVLQKLMVIGEAVARLSQPLRDRYPHVAWHQIKGFRNVVVHGYFNLDWHIVWTTALLDVPELRRQVDLALHGEEPSPPEIPSGT